MNIRKTVILLGVLLSCFAASTPAKKRVVCYIAAWSVTRQGEGKFSVLDADTDHCTHIIYAFMGLDEHTSKIKSIDTGIDGPGGHSQLIKLKQLKIDKPDLKVMVSIGGYNEKGRKFSFMASDSEKRDIFIRSVMDFLEQYQLDGLDVCWQFPGQRGGRPVDKENSVQLFQELKYAFDAKGYQLSVHILGKQYIIDEYDVKTVSNIVDFINLVAVEYSGPWERTTGVMAPLESKDVNNVRFAVDYIVRNGADPNKVNLGLPLYGHAYVLEEVPTEDKLIGLFSNKTFQGPWTVEGGISGFHETCHKFKYVPGWKQVWDEESKTPLAYKGKMFMSFDNEKSLLLKAKLIDDKSLGGVAFWSLDMDDFRGLCFGKRYPMVSAISEYVTQKSKDKGHEPATQFPFYSQDGADEASDGSGQIDIRGTWRNSQKLDSDYPKSRATRSVVGRPSKTVACYIVGSSAGRPGAGKFTVELTDTDHCTHVIYAFLSIDNYTNKIKTINTHDSTEIPKLKGLKKKNSHLKVLVSIGGWNQGSERFSNMAASLEKRNTFINSVLKFISEHELDGVDMSWQFPTQRGGKPEDRTNSLTLFKELKRSFEPKNLILTIHVVGTKSAINSYDIKAITEVVDFINFAAFDYHGPWEQTLQPASPLTSVDESNMKFNLDYILQKGVSPNKILLGLPTFGHSYSLPEDARGKYLDIFFDHATISPWTNEAGLMGYNELCYEMFTNKEGWKIRWEENSQTPIAACLQQLVTYDDEKSLKLKARLVHRKHLAGVMFWSLDTDDFRGLCNADKKYPLVSTVSEYLNKPQVLRTTRRPQQPEKDDSHIVSHSFGNN